MSGGEPTSVRVRMLGGFSISVENRTVEEGAWRLRKAAGLVKLLALEPGHRMHRERAMDLLWPDLDPGAAANNLHQALYVARRALDPTPAASSRCLGLRGEQLELCPERPLWVDVEAFEDAAATARHTRELVDYRAALGLYAGDLLPQDPYEHWTDERREGLRKTYLSLLAEMARLHEEREELEPAIEALEKAVAAEPAHEEAHAGLMRLHALRGRRSEALKQYERLRGVLSREYDAEPTAASRWLYEEIIAGRFSPAHPPLPAGSPPEEPPDASRHNLPIARTSFVGRERELDEVKRLLSTTRLLTLTGAGGCGKTRLALEAARGLVGAYRDGVWLVELAPLSEGELVPQEVAEALEVREQPNRPLVDTLVDALRNRNMLLVLDNCEHLVDATARLVDALLGSCPELRILATSREALDVAGEVNRRVPSLSLPETNGAPTMEELSGYESARLFVERARYRDPAFAPTERDARDVAEICRRLDGIPLAIELAAARVGALSVGQIAQRLEDSLKLLTAGGRTAAPRHRTLRGTLDWSYELLTEPEKRLFSRLSTFAGGWTLAAAEAVGEGDSIEKDDVLDLLSRLVDKSLVVAEAGAEEGALRYRLLEPVRRYARERLEGGGEAEETERRHAEWYLGLAERTEPELSGPGSLGWLDRLEAEHDNLRAALSWSLDRGEAGLGLRLVAALWWFWYARGHLSEGRRWLEGNLSLSDPTAIQARAWALNGAGWIAMFQGEFEAAKTFLEEGLALFRKLEDKEGIASALTNLGFVAVLGQRDDIPVPALLQEATGLKPELEDRRTVAYLLILEGLAAASRGELDHAIELHEESLTLFREVGDVQGLGGCLTNTGAFVLARADHLRASELFRESLRVAREADDKTIIQLALFGLATVSARQGQPVGAARLWGASEAVREAFDIELSPMAHSFMGYENNLSTVRSRLGEAAFEEAWAEGKAMTTDQAMEYTLSEEETTPHTAPTPASPPRNGKHNLPVPKSSFVGREKELVEVKGRLSTSRLLTLTGAGGSGKTRLALEVARGLVGAYPDGVWLVELAGLSDPELVPQEVADALEIREQPNRPLVGTLVGALGDKRMLLVLDNCEHLVDAAAYLVDALLGSCPNLRVLATSREALGVAGEVNRRVPSLSLPDPGRPLTVEELTGYESARLFVERALSRPGAFAPTDQNAQAVAEICRRLDGVPLAIELAAARVGALSVEQISERLENSPKLLTMGNRTSPPRHQTLKGALDWSHELLSEQEKALFGRVSVFAGGWTLAAAEAVGAGGGIERDDVLDLLSRLVDKSLVVAEATGEGAPRYRLLEPVRQYGRERLEEEGEESEETKRRHAEWCLRLAEEAEQELSGPDQPGWLERLDTEHDNLRAALSWLLDGREAGLGLRLAAALWLFWFMRGHLNEGREWLERAISRGGSTTSHARAKALNGAGWIACLQGEYGAAKGLLEESLALYRELEDEEGIASSLTYLGFVAAVGQRDDIPMLALLEEAMRLRPKLKDRRTIGNLLVFEGLVAASQSDWERAVALHDEALALFREIRDIQGMIYCFSNLGLIALARADYEGASTLLRENLRLGWESDHKMAIQYSFIGLAGVATSRGQPARAARLWGAAEGMREAFGVHFTSLARSRTNYDSYLAAARSWLDEAAFQEAWAEGKAMTPEEATEYALSEEEPTPPTPPTPASPPQKGKHNLPAPKSSFVGREKELVEVKGRLDKTRLLTLTGAGGSGKTRLALKVAGDLVGAYRDGAWLVELAPLSEPNLVPQAVAEALSVLEQQNRSLTETLVVALREKEILLVLDNCEHLVDAVARLVDTLLGACPVLEVLATSREALGVAGEVNWPVPTLSLPEPGRPLAVEELKGYESARLFVERAQHRSSVFALTEQNSRAVAEICRRLDGIPLAIELAAARVGVLSVEQISERLENSLKLLASGNRTTAPRHQTLKGTLDWSHELLGEPERRLFRRLSVFAGGWTLEAAEAVVAGGGIEEEDVLDLLSRLVDRSLVVAGTGTEEGALRYRLLEPVRQYAEEKLEEGGEADAIRSRHARWYLALAEEADKESDGPGFQRWLDRLEIEHDNLRAALRWSLDEGDAELGLRLAGSLWLFWFTRGHSTEGRRWLEESISLGGPPTARAKALNGAGWITIFQGDLERAKTLLEESLALYRELKDEEGIASSLNYLGYVALLGGREDIPAAALLGEALALKPRLENRRTIANTLVFAALDALLLRGDYDEAVALQEEALALFREVEDTWSITACLINLGLIAAALGHHTRATTLLRELMRLSRELDYKFGSQYSFFGLACVADSEGHTARAARLWGVSEAIREAAGLQLPSSTLSVMRYESRLAEARARLGEAVFEAAWAEGKAMTPEEATEYALSEEEPAPPAATTPEATPAGEPLVKLTRREREVAELVARGLTNRRIASELTLSKRTVDNHVRNILKKLNLSSREQVAARVE